MSEVSWLGARPVLEVSDLARARAIWCDRLGFRVVAERDDVLVVRAGEAEVALERSARPRPGRALLHVTGVEPLYHRCVDGGLTASAGLHTHESGRRDFELEDPDGNHLRFVEEARPGARVAGLSLAVGDPARSLAFWRAVVGFDAEGDDLATDGRHIASIAFAHGVAPMWWTHFAVESMEEALAEVEARGGVVVIRGDALSVVQDPNGAMAALVPG